MKAIIVSANQVVRYLHLALRPLPIALCLLLILSSVPTALSQVPQGFNYQAAARTGTGEPIKNVTLPVRITIQTTPSGGTVLWKETHSVLTDPFGVMSFIVGSGTRVEGLTNFSDISWGSQTLYIKTEIEYPVGTTYKDLGTTQIWSVPYSLTTKDVQGTLGKLGIKGATASLDEPLFEVKNNNNQTIFAVYNEGVRVYVDDGSKGKGGFSVGGFGDAKAVSQPYLQVARDYTRVYTNNNPAKGVKGGFAVGGFDAKTDPNYFMNITRENYLIGELSGLNITSGINNSFLGYTAGRDNTEGSNNIFLGSGAGLKNTVGYLNLFIGNQAGNNNLNGFSNVFLGDRAGYNTNGGSYGWEGSSNVFIGPTSGYRNTQGAGNIFIGEAAGMNNAVGNLNIYIGKNSGQGVYDGTTGVRNTFIGVSTGEAITSGDDNIFIGNQAAQSSSSGDYNTIVGSLAGWKNGTGSNNVYLGSGSGANNQNGMYNVYVGSSAGSWASSGSSNTFVGYQAGASTSGSNNVFIGYTAGIDETGNHKLYIENSWVGPDLALIYGEFDNDLLKLNGTVKIRDLLKLQPRTQPSSAEAGDIYFDSGLKKLRVYDGTAWQNCW